MRSAVERLPRCRTLLTIWVTSSDRWTGSGVRLRRGAGPLRGMSAVLLGAVAAAGLLAVLDARRVERAADDLVANAREVTDTTATDHHDRVLLEVVALTRDVGRDLDAACEPDTGDLAQRGVRLLRRRRVDAGAHATALGRTAKGGRLALRGLVLAALADQLLDRGHERNLSENSGGLASERDPSLGRRDMVRGPPSSEQDRRPSRECSGEPPGIPADQAIGRRPGTRRRRRG